MYVCMYIYAHTYTSNTQAACRVYTFIRWIVLRSQYNRTCMGTLWEQGVGRWGSGVKVFEPGRNQLVFSRKLHVAMRTATSSTPTVCPR